MKYNTKKRRIKKALIKSVLINSLLLISTLVIVNWTVESYETAEISWKAPRYLPKNEYRNDLTVEEQIRAIAKEHAFPYTDFLIRLAVCESSLNPNAVGDNGFSRGLYQIHKGYHAVSDEDAFDIRFSTEFTMEKILQGKQHLWSCDKMIKNKTLAEVKKMRGL